MQVATTKSIAGVSPYPRALVAGGTDVLRDVCLHELLEKHCHGTPQEIGRRVCQHSAQVLKQWYIRGGHSAECTPRIVTLWI